MAFTGFSRTYSIFEDQFDPKGSGYLYRKSGKGPGYVVTKAEREAFVSRFKWSIRGAAVLMLITMSLSIAVLALQPKLMDSGSLDAKVTAVSIAFVALLLVPFILIYRYAMQYPNNALLGRFPVSPALSKEEVKRKFYNKLSYRQLAIVPFITLIWLAPGRGRHEWLNPMHGTARLWWLAFAAFAGLAGIQAYRKWSFEKSERS